MPVSVERTHEIDRARRLTDSLFAQVRPEAFFDRPIAERHRILFYLGHLEAFDWNQLGKAALGLPSPSPALDELFAFGIDPPPGELPSDEPGDWPSLEETRSYARSARARVDEILDRAPAASLHMAIEHRLMHAETFAYILHNLAYDRRTTPADAPPAGGDAPDSRLIEILAGAAALGRAPGGEFGWDNEFGSYEEPVPAFAMRRYKVTNGEYLRFVEEGAEAPHYWARRGREWRLRGVACEMPLPLDWPVYASHDQAEAFARWAGGRLPTEAQYQRAAYGAPDGTARRYPWGNEPPSAERGNFDFHRMDPLPVTATPAGRSAFGVDQFVGNGWEWTSSVFAPFPGFAAAPTYPGYSANFFDGEHYVLKGASPVTAASLVRPTFRNWFRKHYPYAYSTFRLVEN